MGYFAQGLDHIEAIHVWHGDIQQNKGDLVVMLLGHFEALATT